MSTGSVHYTALDVRGSNALGFVGQASRSFKNRFISLLNQEGQAAQVTTISVPATVDNSTDYVITESGTGATATYTTDASATQAELGAGLVSAIQAVPEMYNLFTPSYAGSTLTLTGQYPGIAFTVTVNSDDTTNDLGTPSTSTSAASASTVAFGLAMIKEGYQGSEAYGKVPAAADYSAQVITDTYASVASGDIIASIVEFRGQKVVVQTPFDTDHATTLTNHTANLNTEFDSAFGAGTGLVAANATDDITVTAENPGEAFDLFSTVSGAGGGTVTKAYTTGAPGDPTSDFLAQFAGFSHRRTDIEDVTLAGDDPAYKANAMVEVLNEGAIRVSNSQGVSYNDAVYVSLASGTEGQLYNAVAANYVWVPRSVLVWETADSTDSTALVRVRATRS